MGRQIYSKRKKGASGTRASQKEGVGGGAFLSRLGRNTRYEKVVLSGDNLTENEVLAFLEKRAKAATCYVIKNGDGNMMKVKEGVKTCFDWLGGSVLIAGDTAFFKEETCCGSPMKYLLKN